MKKKLTRCIFKKYTVFQLNQVLGFRDNNFITCETTSTDSTIKKKTCKNPTQFDLLQTLHYCAGSHSQPITKHL